MKALLILVLLVTAQITKAQSILKDSIPKKGFYSSINELIENNPSLPFDYLINQKEINTSKGFKTNRLTLYNVIIEKDSAENIGDIFGFCDGKNIYLKTGNIGTFANYKSNNFNPKSNFVKLNSLDVYTIFQSVGTMNYGGGIAGSLSIANNSLEYILNLKTKEVQPLTMKLVKQLLADEADLFAEFNSDKNRKKNYEKYIIEYNKRYKAKF